MKKLTSPQQSVVDMMSDGWELKYDTTAGYATLWKGHRAKKVNNNVFNSLTLSGTLINFPSKVNDAPWVRRYVLARS